MKQKRKLFLVALSLIVVFVMFSSVVGCDGDSQDSAQASSDVMLDLSGESMSFSQDFVVSDWFDDYESILKEYRRFAGFLIDDDIDGARKNNTFGAADINMGYHWGCMIVETNIWSYREFPKTKEAFGFALEDLNGDGNPELILLLQDYTVLAVFSTVESEVKLLDAFYSRHDCGIDNTGTLYTCSSGGAFYFSRSSYKISPDGSELILIEEFGADGYLTGENATFYYKLVNGDKTRISDADFNELSSKFPKRAGNDTRAYKITQNSGMTYIPLFGPEL